MPKNRAKEFDQYLNGGFSKKDVDKSLSEIYQDEGGRRINVKEVEIKERRGFFTRAGIIALYVLIAAGIGVGIYYWVVSRGANSTAVDISISAPENLLANEDFEYTIEYRNQENVSITDAELTVTYPESFMFISASEDPSNGNNTWSLKNIRAFSSGQIKVKGKIIAPVGASNMLFADITYHPANISSEFKKSVSFETLIAGSGLDFVAAAPTSVLVNQDAEFELSYKQQEKSFLDGFTVRFNAIDNLEFPTSDYGPDVTMSEPGVFVVSKVAKAEKNVKLKFKFKDKKNDTEDLKIQFQYRPDEGSKEYTFEEKAYTLEVVKNSLNLTISANGEPSDQGIDFGETVNYSISYVNKGEQTMNDVIVMAVLDGDALDWRKLIDKNNGKITGRTILWTKTEIPALATISKGQEGTIDFSVPVRNVNEASLVRQFDIKSYAQFAIGGKTEDLSAENDTNRSNQLSIKLNSDASLNEAVRYFDDDNIAVGTGPLPPQTGTISTFKVYWKVTNSLHELGALKVTTKLPDYVSWDSKEQTDTGTLTYNQETNEVSWLIGRLPLSASVVEAQFSIAIKPKTTDRNKILILVSGTKLEGTDNQTTFPISQILKAQTTKLENDDIADTNGIVQ